MIEDKLALYKALGVLFPEETREEIFNKKNFDMQELAERMQIPLEHMGLLMSEDWADIWKTLVDKG